MGLASKIKQNIDTTNTQAQAAPAAPYGGAGSPYYGQRHDANDGYGGGNPTPYSPSAPPPPSQYYAQQNDGYGGSYPSLQSPSAPPFGYGSAAPPVSPSRYQAQQSDGYGDGSFSSQPCPYPYPSHPQQQSYAQGSHPQQQSYEQGYPYPGTQPSYAGFDKQQTSPYSGYPNYPYPQPHSQDAGSHDPHSNHAYGAPPYQQPNSYAPPVGVFSANNADVLANKLQYIVQCHGLQRYYDASRFRGVLQKLSAIDFGKIAAQWKIGKELAYDLAPLALYDIVFYCDDSGSMAFEENGERINDLRFILSKVSGIATLFDDDGIVVRFMNSNVRGDGVRNATDVEMLMSQVRFSGATPLGTNLDRKVIQPFVLGQAMDSTSGMAKPVLVIVITDGEPYGESRDMIMQVIRRAKDALARTPYGSGALAIQIAQVGKDAKTQKFLETLDKDPIVGGMIDCTSYYEMEEEEFARKGVTLTPELWLLKMCVGAIDPEYDAKDD